MKPDGKLKSDVEAELDWDPSINANTIGVAAQNGVVTLSGHVSTYSQKLAAERAVQRVEGVKAMAVDLEVRLPGHPPSDDEIAAAAVDALRWNAKVPPHALSVRVEDGCVTLSGTVRRAYEKAAAESAVRHLLGVRDVVNAMKLDPTEPPEDVKSKIEAALQRSAHCEGEAIDVQVDGGRVTLRGKVHSLHAREVVEDAAWAAPGISQVIDELTVGP